MNVATARSQDIFRMQQKNKYAVGQSSVEARIEKLDRLKAYLIAGTDDICAATYNDMGKPAAEALIGELSVVISEISYVRKHIRRWLKPQHTPATLISIGTTSYVQYEAKGIVLILSPWNYPVSLPLKPLIYAIAAGCVAIIKPSEYAPFSSEFISRLVSDLFPENEVAVVEGDAEVSKELLAMPFDHIFFTGSTAVGKMVMKAAADHLTSVTLELGGKSPSIVDETADIKATAERIVWGKFYNNGQTCIAPDYVLVQKNKKQELLEALKATIRKMYNPDGAGIENSESYGRIVNEKHLHRLISLLDDATEKGAQVLFGGNFDVLKRFLEPTLLSDVTMDMRLMQEEIFGPLLPIVEYDQPGDAVGYIRSIEKPLALYIHSESRKNTEFLLNNTSSGNALVNEVLTQFGNAEIPFGGVNHSGIGKSNGFYGFREFTNAKGVTKRKFGTIRFVYPPYSSRLVGLIKKVLPWL